MPKVGAIILLAIAVIIVALISFQNPQNTSIQFFGTAPSLPLYGVVLISFFIGLVPSIGFSAVKQQKAAISDTKVKEWEKQDEKLITEIESDKVKQLEAKIETLETALKAALGKKK